LLQSSFLIETTLGNHQSLLLSSRQTILCLESTSNSVDHHSLYFSEKEMLGKTTFCRTGRMGESGLVGSLLFSCCRSVLHVGERIVIVEDPRHIVHASTNKHIIVICGDDLLIIHN
jgi:hypothetical protein